VMVYMKHFILPAHYCPDFADWFHSCYKN